MLYEATSEEITMLRVASVSFLQDVFQSIADQGRHLVDLARRAAGAEDQPGEGLLGLVRELLSGRGEASGVALAAEIMRAYAAQSTAEKTRFLLELNSLFLPTQDAIRAAFSAYDAAPSQHNLAALAAAVESPRQEVIRRLNLAPGNTLGLVTMRADLLARLDAHPELMGLDGDFVHLFSSWFNRGFLMVRRIDWRTPAHILEKIIRYEAVHAIESWDDLRRRLEPVDRRCFAFFHPALADEPLIFVEVALTRDIPDAIQPILAADRAPLRSEQATTACFYSISNCQQGLARISFGNFLIKQVAEELRRELPGIHVFATLSPIPGFRAWVESKAAQPSPLDPLDSLMLTTLTNGGPLTPAAVSAAAPAIRRALATYLLTAKGKGGKPLNPVARFHLGNGASLERLNTGADLSSKGLGESFGAMVNYLYDLPLVEERHELYAATGGIATSAAVRRELKT
jgi:malonyl-CoA decarboxylase